METWQELPEPVPPPTHPVHTPQAPEHSPEPRAHARWPLLLAASAGLVAFPLLRRRRKQRRAAKVDVVPVAVGSGVPGAPRAYEGIIQKIEGLWQLNGAQGRYRTSKS